MWAKRSAGALALSAGLALLIGASPVRATTILDQDSTGSPAGDLWNDNNSRTYQVFTVGQEGTLAGLEIELTVVPASGFRLVLGAIDPAFDPLTALIPPLAPLPAVDLSFSIPPAPGVLAVDLLSFGIPVSVGDRFVFTLVHEDLLALAGASDYAGGNAWFACLTDVCVDPLDPAGSVDPFTGVFAIDEAGVGLRSVAFRSFVAVPEPAGLALAALLGGMAAAVSRRRH